MTSVSFSLSTPPPEMGLLLNPDLADLTRMAGQRASGISCHYLPVLGLQACALCPVFYLGVRDPNSDPCVWADTSTAPDDSLDLSFILLVCWEVEIAAKLPSLTRAKHSLTSNETLSSLGWIPKSTSHPFPQDRKRSLRILGKVLESRLREY